MDFIEIIFKVSKFLLFLMWMPIVCVLSSIHCYNYEFLIICVHMRRMSFYFFLATVLNCPVLLVLTEQCSGALVSL